MPIQSLAELNARNRHFWDQQVENLWKRMANDAIRETALTALSCEQVRGLPIRFQTTIEGALKTAEQTKGRLLEDLARKGGEAKKSDALQLLIQEIVHRNPSITVTQLLGRLTAHQGFDPIQDIEGGIIWFTHKGGSKQAKLSGLKDRLSRAKAKLRSR